jgi:hypothetical protein
VLKKITGPRKAGFLVWRTMQTKSKPLSPEQADVVKVVGRMVEKAGLSCAQRAEHGEK